MHKNLIQFSHANGFPALSYKKIFSLLEDQFDIQYIEMLGHNPKFPVSDNWQSQVHELIDALDSQNSKHSNSKPVIGLGHSLGGAITFFAAIERPDLFQCIVLLDTPIFSFHRAKMVQLFKNLGKADWITPGGRAKRRRTSWPSAEEVLAYFKTRPLFHNFDEQCLRDYVTYGTLATSEGVALKFDPMVESQIYLTLPHNYSEYKHKLKVPCVAIVGKESTVVKASDIRSMKKNFQISCKLIEGGHLFPFEHPEETAEMIKQSIFEMSN